MNSAAVDQKLQDEAKAAQKAGKAAKAAGSASPTVPSPVEAVSAGVAKMAVNGTGAGAGLTPPAIKAKWSGPSGAPSPLAARINAVTQAKPQPASPVAPTEAEKENGEGVSFEEAKRRAAERELDAQRLAEANDDPNACTMCSG